MRQGDEGCTENRKNSDHGTWRGGGGEVGSVDGGGCKRRGWLSRRREQRKEGGMEGKRVPREREWNQYVEAHTSVCLRSHMRVSVWPGEAKHASFHARGVDKGGRLLSPLPSSLPLRVQPSRPHTRVRPYSYAEFDGIECYWNFFSCLPPRNKQFAQISREIIVAGLLREGNELGNCRGSYCSLFVNFIHDFYTFSYFSLVSFVECVLKMMRMIF